MLTTMRSDPAIVVGDISHLSIIGTSNIRVSFTMRTMIPRGSGGGKGEKSDKKQEKHVIIEKAKGGRGPEDGHNGARVSATAHPCSLRSSRDISVI
jgi:hypothetical protein